MLIFSLFLGKLIFSYCRFITKQARKSSEDAQATGYTQLEKVQAEQIWGRKSLGPTY